MKREVAKWRHKEKSKLRYKGNESRKMDNKYERKIKRKATQMNLMMSEQTKCLGNKKLQELTTS